MDLPNVIAIDLETTGVDPWRDQILSIGAVDIWTGEFFYRELHYPRISGSPYAMYMNAELLKRNEAGVSPQYALSDLEAWVDTGGDDRPMPVGFNVGAFDMAFLKRAGVNCFHYRTIELGTLYCKDGRPQSSSRVAREILNEDVMHNALDDAMQAAKLYLLHLAKNPNAALSKPAQDALVRLME